MAAFLNVPDPPRGRLSGCWGALAPGQEHILPRVQEDEESQLGTLCPQPEMGEKRAGAEGLELHGEHSALSTKSALNPSACWPVATLGVGWMVVCLKNGMFIWSEVVWRSRSLAALKEVHPPPDVSSCALGDFILHGLAFRSPLQPHQPECLHQSFGVKDWTGFAIKILPGICLTSSIHSLIP